MMDYLAPLGEFAAVYVGMGVATTIMVGLPSLLDFATRRHVENHGRLPPQWWLGVVITISIICWPKVLLVRT